MAPELYKRVGITPEEEMRALDGLPEVLPKLPVPSPIASAKEVETFLVRFFMYHGSLSWSGGKKLASLLPVDGKVLHKMSQQDFVGIFTSFGWVIYSDVKQSESICSQICIVLGLANTLRLTSNCRSPYVAGHLGRQTC